MKKYILYPGWVQSINDGEWHYIDGPTLAQLYKVDMKDCVLSDQLFREMTPLFPRRDGNYSLDNKSGK